MKRAALLICSIALTHFASARTIPLAKGGSFPISDQAVVNADGITFVPAGSPKPFTLKWQDIDLVRLAKQDAEVEASRQKALLTGEKTVLAPAAPKANPYAEFLALPVKVTFRPKETRQSRVDFNSVTTPVGPLDPITGQPTAIAGIPQTVTSASSTRSDTTINATRQPIDTTAAGFLELISDDTRGATGNLIRELHEHPDVFTNLIAALRELQTQIPEDVAPTKAIESIQAISRPGSVSVDALRQLSRFVRYAQSRAGAK